ncbi:MAG: phosphotransferase family protein [Deltaproteobacteria bacterium]|nr:phosphotransferase family protein [Deltaproteobacteria bacterium]
MSTDLIDTPRDVRPGEELDATVLARYLATHLPELGVLPLEIRQFPGGHSNLTYALRAGDNEYVLRRPPFGSKVKSAHDMGREYRVLSRLHAAFPLAPEPLHYCEDESVIGARFYVMRRLRGVIVRRSIPPELGLTGDRLRALHLGLVDNLARIHGVDYAAAGLADLGKPEGYVERQVSGWIKRYHDSKTDDLPVVDQVARWLAENLPGDSGAALLHNDYKLDNLVLSPDDPTKIVGVLDWEMATIGDPLLDLGAALAYWIEPDDDATVRMMRWGPTDEPGGIRRAEFLARYQEASGRAVPNPLYYFVFGCFKNAVIIQQIYYRYKQGLTKDERFANILPGVFICCQHAASRLDAGTL